MTKGAYSVAVVGATGLVGAEIIAILEQRQFPLAELQLYASGRSAGGEVRCGDLHARVDLLERAHFTDTDLVFLAAGEQVTAEWVERATGSGAVAIDVSQLFAADEDIPMIVPEVNADELAGYDVRNIVACPDATATALAVALHPVHTAAQITRLVASTFEPVSSAGRAGIEELQQQTVELLNGRTPEIAVFAQRIAFNALPQVGEFLAGGVTRSESQTACVLRRLLHAPELVVGITRVQLPLFFGEGIAVNVETVDSLGAAQARELLRTAPGVLLHDDPSAQHYPTTADVVGQDATFVGRIRETEAAHVLDLFVTIDNVRKGAALNAVQIAELLIRHYL